MNENVNERVKGNRNGNGKEKKKTYTVNGHVTEHEKECVNET